MLVERTYLYDIVIYFRILRKINTNRYAIYYSVLLFFSMLTAGYM